MRPVILRVVCVLLIIANIYYYVALSNMANELYKQSELSFHVPFFALALIIGAFKMLQLIAAIFGLIFAERYSLISVNPYCNQKIIYVLIVLDILCNVALIIMYVNYYGTATNVLTKWAYSSLIVNCVLYCMCIPIMLLPTKSHTQRAIEHDGRKESYFFTPQKSPVKHVSPARLFGPRSRKQ